MSHPLYISDRERDLIIRSLTVHGRTARQTAEIVNRPEGAVRRVARGAGLSIPRHKPAAKQYRDLALSIPLPIWAALERAAYWRDQEPEMLAVHLLHGVLAHGNVSKTLSGLSHHGSL
jgi:hypothetical protein